MRGFDFKAPADPLKPLDPNDDPPPKGWDTGINTQDYRKALFGHRTPLFEKCVNWEERELARHADHLKTE